MNAFTYSDDDDDAKRARARLRYPRTGTRAHPGVAV